MNKEIEDAWLDALDDKNEWSTVKNYLTDNGWCINFNAKYKLSSKFHCKESVIGMQYRPKSLNYLR
jgi:hypothetical protein